MFFLFFRGFTRSKHQPTNKSTAKASSNKARALLVCRDQWLGLAVLWGCSVRCVVFVYFALRRCCCIACKQRPFRELSRKMPTQPWIQGIAFVTRRVECASNQVKPTKNQIGHATPRMRFSFEVFRSFLSACFAVALLPWHVCSAGKSSKLWQSDHETQKEARHFFPSLLGLCALAACWAALQKKKKKHSSPFTHLAPFPLLACPSSISTMMLKLLLLLLVFLSLPASLMPSPRSPIFICTNDVAPHISLSALPTSPEHKQHQVDKRTESEGGFWNGAGLETKQSRGEGIGAS